MTAKKRFWIGGVGALMPVLVSLATLDVGLIDTGDLNLGTAIGLGIRYTGLFILGGVVTYFHEEEEKPFKLFEIGIAAPALLTSLVTAQAIRTGPDHDVVDVSRGFEIVSTAHAQAGPVDGEPGPPMRLAGGFLDQVIRGATGKVYQTQKPAPAVREPASLPRPEPEPEPVAPAPAPAPPLAERVAPAERSAPAERAARPVFDPEVFQPMRREMPVPTACMNLEGEVAAACRDSQDAARSVVRVENELRQQERRLAQLRRERSVAEARARTAEERFRALSTQ